MNYKNDNFKLQYVPCIFIQSSAVVEVKYNGDGDLGDGGLELDKGSSDPSRGVR